jgi:hypothetical protein
MEDFLSGLLQKACVFCFASSCYSRSRRSSLEEIIIPGVFDPVAVSGMFVGAENIA